MISPANHRRIASLVAICYVLASTLSGLWHSHAGEEFRAAERSAAFAGANHGDHHEHADHAGEACEGGNHESCPAGDDDCVVCRFVAQSALATLPVAEPGPSVVVAEVRPIPPAAPIAVLLTSALARAPPAAG